MSASKFEFFFSVFTRLPLAGVVATLELALLLIEDAAPEGFADLFASEKDIRDFSGGLCLTPAPGTGFEVVHTCSFRLLGFAACVWLVVVLAAGRELKHATVIQVKTHAYSVIIVLESLYFLELIHVLRNE